MTAKSVIPVKVPGRAKAADGAIVHAHAPFVTVPAAIAAVMAALRAVCVIETVSPAMYPCPGAATLTDVAKPVPAASKNVNVIPTPLPEVEVGATVKVSPAPAGPYVPAVATAPGSVPVAFDETLAVVEVKLTPLYTWRLPQTLAKMFEAMLWHS